MPKLSIKVSDSAAEAIQTKAIEKNLSVSEYLANLIQKDLSNDWPDGFFELFGAWEGKQLSREDDFRTLSK